MSGNVFKDTHKIYQWQGKQIFDKFVSRFKEENFNFILSGSCANPTKFGMTGDIDIFLDTKDIMKFFDVKSANKARTLFKQYILKKKNDYKKYHKFLNVKQIACNIHVEYEEEICEYSKDIDGKEYIKEYQPYTKYHIDILVVDNAEAISKFHIHNIPKDSPFKGAHKQIVLGVIAKNSKLFWSPLSGLYHRTPEGNKGKFISRDLNKIAKTLLGKECSATDLECFESIMKTMSIGAMISILDEVRKTKRWKSIK